MKVAIMQPYIFPYLAYFQLVNTADVFVFCDDVNFIKGGWIHRNLILFNGEPRFISFPLHKSSQNKWINELTIKTESKEFLKLLPTIRQAYLKAPQFKFIYPIIEKLMINASENLAVFASETVMAFANYLEIKTKYLYTSEAFTETKGLEKSDRIIRITKKLNAADYINPIGGQEIYDKAYFFNQDIRLRFLHSEKYTYPQFENEFISNLSMIDLLMFNDKIAVKAMLEKYKLI